MDEADAPFDGCAGQSLSNSTWVQAGTGTQRRQVLSNAQLTGHSKDADDMQHLRCKYVRSCRIHTGGVNTTHRPKTARVHCEETTPQQQRSVSRSYLYSLSALALEIVVVLRGV